MNRGASAPPFFFPPSSTTITGLMAITEQEQMYADALSLGVEAPTDDIAFECVLMAESIGQGLTSEQRKSIRSKLECAYHLV